MSDKNENDATHPANMSQEDLQKNLALLEEDDLIDGGDGAGGAGAAEGGAGDGGAGAGAGADGGDGAGVGAEGGSAAAAAAGVGGDAGAAAAGAQGAADAGAGTGAGAGGAQPGAEGAQAGDDDTKPVSRAQFNGVLNDLRATREEVKELRAKQTAAPSLALPDARDFKAEKAALHEKWDAGEIDTDEYNDQRDALTVAEAEYRSELKFHSLQQAHAQQQASDDWTKAITSWSKENADFLANPLRSSAVNQVLAALEADPATANLSNEELIARAQDIAFEAFNWKREAAGAATPAQVRPDPRAVAAAHAASAASATPPLPGRGAGSALTASQVKLEELKPGEFGKLPANVQKELLGE